MTDVAIIQEVIIHSSRETTLYFSKIMIKFTPSTFIKYVGKLEQNLDVALQQAWESQSACDYGTRTINYAEIWAFLY